MKNDLILPHCMAKYRRTKLQWHRGGVRKGVGGGAGGGLGGEGEGLEELVQNQHLLDEGREQSGVVTAFIGPEYQLWAYALIVRSIAEELHFSYIHHTQKCIRYVRGCATLSILHEKKRCSHRRIYCCTDSMLYKKNTLKPTFPENR